MKNTYNMYHFIQGYNGFLMVFEPQSSALLSVALITVLLVHGLVLEKSYLFQSLPQYAHEKLLVVNSNEKCKYCKVLLKQSAIFSIEK